MGLAGTTAKKLSEYPCTTAPAPITAFSPWLRRKNRYVDGYSGAIFDDDGFYSPFACLNPTSHSSGRAHNRSLRDNVVADGYVWKHDIHKDVAAENKGCRF